ncbi:MAG: phosphate ABC transporter substrate-binding protein PstS [Thermoguttaceae bacterium]|jgi:phosphate transport system substrate-binding protein
MGKFQVNMIGVMFLFTFGIAVGCSKKVEEPAGSITIKGAGSTFVAPLFRKWFEEYHKQHPNVVVDYDVVGSGEGTKLFLEDKVDFGASDAALTDEEIAIASAKRGAVLIPVTAGSIVLAYSPEGLPAQLKLSRSVYADIFLGKITHWNDDRIAAINPGITFPDRDIQVVARNDSSGTTFALTNHLSAVSEEWRKNRGVGKTMGWPNHVSRVNGNEGVAGQISLGVGMIGYVEYGTAKRAGLGMAWLENKAGNYIKPTGTSGLETLLQTKMPTNLVVFMPDPDGKDSYPIVTYSWLLLYEIYDDPKKLDALKDMVRSCLDDGQQESESLGYIRLAPSVVSVATHALGSISNR